MIIKNTIKASIVIDRYGRILSSYESRSKLSRTVRNRDGSRVNEAMGKVKTDSEFRRSGGDRQILVFTTHKARERITESYLQFLHLHFLMSVSSLMSSWHALQQNHALKLSSISVHRFFETRFCYRFTSSALCAMKNP